MADASMPTISNEAETVDEWSAMLDKLADKFVLGMASVSSVAAPLSVLRVIDTGWLFNYGFHIFGWLCICSIYYFREHFSPGVKAALMASVAILVALAGVWNFGLLATSPMLLSIGCLSLAIYFPPRVTVPIMGACFLYFIVVGVGFVRGDLALPFDANAYVRRSTSWALMVVSVTLLVAFMMYAITVFRISIRTLLSQSYLHRDQLASALSEAEMARQQATLALNELRAAQTQVIQSEKMASLGQLVANVAHEINTPIGAIKSSGKSIVDSLDHAMEKLPGVLALLNGPEQELFTKLVLITKNRRDMVSTREERALVRETSSMLEEAGVEGTHHAASILVQLGAHTALSDYMPLLRRADRDQILDVAYGVATVVGSAVNINTAVDRVSKIVFALKSYARMDGSGELRDADIAEGIEVVLTIYQNQIKQGTELIRQYDNIAPLRCLPDELGQVWSNLIHNALQAMNNRGTLSICIRQLSDEVLVSVGDSGGGIPEGIRGKIFDAFFTTKPVGEGSGLGLDIVKKIVEKHRGRIEVDSEVGVGTTFSIYLPMHGA